MSSMGFVSVSDSGSSDSDSGSSSESSMPEFTDGDSGSDVEVGAGEWDCDVCGEWAIPMLSSTCTVCGIQRGASDGAKQNLREHRPLLLLILS